MQVNRARRRVGLRVLVVFLALGTGWLLERAIRGPHALGGAPIGEPRSNGGAATGAPAPPSGGVRPASTEPEYDRSDLILSQG
jgi:hypothetical protein